MARRIKSTMNADTRLAPRRPERGEREAADAIRDAERAEHRDVEPEEELDYERLAGASEYSAEVARGPDETLAREVPSGDFPRQGEGPPRTETLSESPEDIGERYLERYTEAPRRHRPQKRRGGD